MARSVVVVEVKGYKIEPGADLSGANLEEANLGGANLKEADLYSAFLYSANLNGANLEETLFAYAFANADTIWPDGFDPVAAEVIIM